MQTQIRRSLQRTELLVSTGAPIEETYEWKMFLSCRIAGLLPCRIRHSNGEEICCFDVTEKQSLVSCTEAAELRRDVLLWILSGILRAADHLEEYLLQSEHLCLDPKLIYLNRAKKSISLVFLPFHKQDFRGALRLLMEYLLSKIDRDDQETVVLCYRFYRRTMEKDVSLQVLQSFLQQAANGEASRKKEEGQGTTVYETSGRTDNAKEERKGNNGAPFLQTAKKGGSFEKTEAKDINHSATQAAISAPLFGKKALLILLGALAAIPVMLLYAQLCWQFPEDPSMYAGILLLLAVFAVLLVRFYRRRQPAARKEEFQYPAVPRKPVAFLRKLVKGSIGGTGETDRHAAEESCGGAYLQPIGQNHGEVLWIGGKQFIIGQESTLSDGVIPSDTVSRMHARIRFRRRRYYLSDCGSRNGTFLNGELLSEKKEYLLKDKDRISFADVPYRFRERK